MNAYILIIPLSKNLKSIQAERDNNIHMNGSCNTVQGDSGKIRIAQTELRLPFYLSWLGIGC
jgi:hypothetical protein